MVSIYFLFLAASVIAIPLEKEAKVSSSAALKLSSTPNKTAVTCQVTRSHGCVNIHSGPGASYPILQCVDPGTVSRLLDLTILRADSFF